MPSARSDHHILTLGAREVPLQIRRNRRARRITLSIDHVSGDVHLVLPPRVALGEGLDFAHRKRDWVAARLGDLPPRVPFVAGSVIPLLGADHLIRHAPAARRGVWCADGTIWVSGLADHLPRRVGDFLRDEARRELAARARAKALEVERPLRRIGVRDTVSRWGSCSADGNLNFSWRLILAPEPVLDYVVAHEVAHLVHLHHGPAFWRLVGRLTADRAGACRWLRAHGHRLHRYG